MKRTEREVLAKRKRMIKGGVSLFRVAITKQIKAAFEIYKIIGQVPEALPTADMESVFSQYYAQAADFAMIWRNYLLNSRNGASLMKSEDKIYFTQFQRQMAEYAKLYAGDRIEGITSTSLSYLKDAITRAQVEATDLGLGRDATAELIERYVSELGRTITPGRARIIAQTEMVTAANQAAIQGAKSTGLKFRKFWSTSGLERTRATHIENERHSVEVNGLEENDIFPNGCKFPGDPNGRPEETINCRCTLITEIV